MDEKQFNYLNSLLYQVSKIEPLSIADKLDLLMQYPQIIEYMDDKGNLKISEKELLTKLIST